MTVQLYIAFLIVIGLARLYELRISANNQRRMEQRGAKRANDPVYPWMVALHVGTLLASAAEVVFFQRPWIPWLGAAGLCLWALTNALRFWVIRTLAEHWNTQVVDSTRLGIISSGPYRWVRHPNYVAVFLEMIAIPSIHTAWCTLLVTTVSHILVLRLRIRSEEKVLLADPGYRAAMGAKPRFIPGLF